MAQENQTIEITTELTEQDRRNAMFYNLFFRKKWILGYLIVFVAFSVGVLITKLAGIFNVPTLLCWIAGGFLVLLAGFIGTIFMSSKGGNSQPRKLIFTEKGITTSAGRDNKMISFTWEKLYYIGRTGKCFYIYPYASQFIIVPKRYLTEEEIRRINEYV